LTVVTRKVFKRLANDSFAQLQTDIYNYVKQEIVNYRQAGTMPDLVSIGNEVDTGSWVRTVPRVQLQQFRNSANQGHASDQDAAADTSIGRRFLRPDLHPHYAGLGLERVLHTCESNGIQYDAICQSYYPLFHVLLTSTQAAASNPNNQPVEQVALTKPQNAIGKPIFIIETGSTMRMVSKQMTPGTPHRV